MMNKVINKLGENIFLILALGWVLLCIFPWAIWLDSLPWIRLGISLIIFVAPGMALSLFLVGKRLSLISHLISGVAFSVFFVGSLGLLGRIFHLPFSYIKPVFVLVGMVTFFVLIRHSRSEDQLYKPKRYSVTTLVLFLVVAVLSVITSMGNPFGGDDFSYLAHLTNWQHAQPLDFQEVVFGSGSLDAVRFWSGMFPMNLAFLAEISNFHGLLLLAFYLEPFLVVLSLLSFYNLFEDLLPSGYLPITALLLHFTFLFMLYGNRQPGAMFFYRISEDKVFAAFVLAPVFFLAIRYLLEAITLRSVLFTLLSGLSLALTHPIILAYSVMIAGLYAAFLTFTNKDYKKFGVIMIVLVAVILPSASLRFVGVASRYIFGSESTLRQPGVFNLESALTTVDIGERISYIEHTPFYGFNLERVQARMPGGKINEENPWQKFFSWSYLWILGLSFLWSLFNIKKNSLAAFVGATSLVVLLCAIPYTGWLLGYLVTARMLWRAPWMFSAGLAGVILINELLEFIFRRSEPEFRRQFPTTSVTFGLVFLICLVLISSFSVTFYAKQWDRWLTTFEVRKSKFQTFADLGEYLENNLETVSIFAAPRNREFSDYLPGISSKSRVVFFRSKIFTPQPVSAQDLNPIFSRGASVSLEQRINILRKYHIDYIIVESTPLKNYYASYSEFFRVEKFLNFWIVEFQETKP